MKNWHKFAPLIGSLAVLLITVVAPHQKQSPTFSEDIYPIAKVKCMPCHQARGVAPFSLTSYTDFKRNLRLVKTMALSRSMPPMDIHSDFGEIATTPQLTNLEIITFQHWINGGALEGEPLKPTTPPLSRFTLKSPDHIYESPPELRTKAEGAPYWQVTAIPLGPKAIHLTGFEVSPNTPKSLRHAMVAIVPSALAPTAPYESAGEFSNPKVQLVGVWAPGFPIWQLPAKTTFTIPANSTLLVQSFYQPTGKVEDGGFKVAIQGSDSAGDKLLTSRTVAKKDFVIEAGTNPTLSLGEELQSPTEIFAILPEARFYCASISASATIPNKGAKTLFNTDRWNPYWRGNYVFREPVKLPAKTTLLFQFNYLNDQNCPMNSEKTPTDIVSGPGIDDELCRMHLFTIKPRAAR